MFTELHIHPQSILEHFHHLKETLVSVRLQRLTPLPPPSPWLKRNPLPISMHLPAVDVSYKWNHTTCGLCDWLLSVASYVQDSSTLWPALVVHSCLWPNDTSLNKYTTICLSTQELMNISGCFNFWSVPGPWGWAGEGSGHWWGFFSLHPALLPVSLPLTVCREVPGNLPLMAPSPWSVGGGLHLPSLPPRFSSYPRPHLVSSLPSPSFPTFSVVQRDHHSLPDLLPLQPAFFETSLSASRACKDFSNGYILSPLIRPAVGLWSAVCGHSGEASDSS